MQNQQGQHIYSNAAMIAARSSPNAHVVRTAQLSSHLMAARSSPNGSQASIASSRGTVTFQVKNFMFVAKILYNTFCVCPYVTLYPIFFADIQDTPYQQHPVYNLLCLPVYHSNSPFFFLLYLFFMTNKHLLYI